MEKRVKQIQRYISKSNLPNGGALPVEEVDTYLDSWYAKGYVLVSTHYLGENPEGYGMLYVLHRPSSPA